MKINLEKLANTVVEEFDTFLHGFGFHRQMKESGDHSFTINYTSKNGCYLSIKASTNPRDYPPYFNIILGERTIDWPECDWNSVALWAMCNFKENNEVKSEYKLENVSDFYKFIKDVLKDLDLYNAGFINGDLQVFKRVRALQNQKRDPHKINKPNGKDGYTTEVDSISLKLKDRFSIE